VCDQMPEEGFIEIPAESAGIGLTDVYVGQRKGYVVGERYH
jgi:hypothetical protein